MTRLLCLVTACLLVAQAASAQEDADQPITPDAPIDLFNGEDLAGWTFELRGEGDPADVYRVEDGIIRVSGRPSGIMRTQAAYQNYELEVQWRWPGGGGNSGVLIHCSTPNERNVWPKSLEVQLAHNNAGDFWVIGETIRVNDAQSRTNGRRTTNYTDGSEHELGQWNTVIVRARGNHVTVHVNGELVNEAWDCSASSGAICLQSEGQRVEFRTVQIRPLPAEEPAE